MILPGVLFAEKEGTYVNTERRIQLANKAVDPPGQARGDLDIVIELSTHWPYDAVQVRRGGDGRDRARDSLVARCLARSPRWRARTAYPVAHSQHPGTDFLFDESFPTKDGKASFHPVEFLPPAELPDDEFPFFRNTGRQCITGTRGR